MLEADLAYPFPGGGAAPDRVFGRPAADHRGIDATLVEHHPAQAAHAVAAELGGRAVRVEEDLVLPRAELSEKEVERTRRYR